MHIKSLNFSTTLLPAEKVFFIPFQKKNWADSLWTVEFITFVHHVLPRERHVAKHNPHILPPSSFELSSIIKSSFLLPIVASRRSWPDHPFITSQHHYSHHLHHHHRFSINIPLTYPWENFLKNNTRNVKFAARFLFSLKSSASPVTRLVTKQCCN